MPRLRDVSDPIKAMAFNLGIRKEPVKLGYPSYIERMEYWALVWGSLIMIFSGVVLVFNSFFMSSQGTWITDLATAIHFYEAVLATLAILVWHFYWTIFDPHVYPMNMAWITGRLKLIMKKRTKEK